MLCAFGHVVGVINGALEITFMNYELYLLFVVACVCSLYTILDSWLQLCLLQCIYFYGDFCYIIIVLRKSCLVSLAILSHLSRFSLTVDRQKLTFMY